MASPGVLEKLGYPAPASCFLFPCASSQQQPNPKETLVFQYWPQSLQDDYQTNYAEKGIPGGSHPLYQWVNGAGRTISFEAIFTAELNTNTSSLLGGLGNARVNLFNPSGRFTVDINAALAKLRSWQLPHYPQGGRRGLVHAPKRLCLVFPGTKLAGTSETITVIMRAGPHTYEAWFPNGEPRAATVPLQFNEIVQLPSGSGGSQVKWIGRSAFEASGRNYHYKGSLAHPPLPRV